MTLPADHRLEGHRAFCLVLAAGMFATSLGLWITFLLSSPVYQQYAYSRPSFAMATPLAAPQSAEVAAAGSSAEITTTSKFTPEYAQHGS